MTKPNAHEDTRGYRLEGRVQGVGFRWWASREAGALGLRGWVRNEPDGSVSVHAAGPPARLDELEERLRDGPSAARVAGVRRTGPGEALPPRGFEIRRTPGGGW